MPITRPVFAILSAGAMTFALLAPALACTIPDGTPLTARDAGRMSGFEATRTKAMGEALAAESAADRAELSALYAPGQAAIEAVPDGKYRCRTLKLGGLLPLTVYGYFECTVSGGGTVIEKLTGSQRFKGTLAPAGGGVLYYGALHYGDEQPKPYGEDVERDQVGCIVEIPGTPSRYRLELPAPYFESTMDIIELVGKR